MKIDLKSTMGLMLCATFAFSAQAATRTFTTVAGGGEYLWSDTTKWADGELPQDGDDVVLVLPAGGTLRLAGATTPVLASLTATTESKSGVGLAIRDGVLNLKDGAKVTIDSTQLRLAVYVPVTESNETKTFTVTGKGMFQVMSEDGGPAKWIVDGAVLMVGSDRAFGRPFDETTFDAVTLKNGGVLCDSSYVGNFNLSYGATRGIFLGEGGGILGGDIDETGVLTINGPISGAGDLQYSGNHALVLNGPASNTGVTLIRTSAKISIGNDLAFSPNSLLTNAAHVSFISLRGHRLNVKSVNTTTTFNLYGPGEFRFGEDDAAGDEIQLGRFIVFDGVTLSYAGAGTVKASEYVKMQTGSVLKAETGTIALHKSTWFDESTIELGEGTTLKFADDATFTSVNLRLLGDANLVLPSDFTLLGSVTSAADDPRATLSISGGLFRLGIDTKTDLRTLTARLVNDGNDILLRGYVRTDLPTDGYTFSTGYIPFSKLTSSTVEGTIGICETADLADVGPLTIATGGRLLVVGTNVVEMAAPTGAGTVEVSGVVATSGDWSSVTVKGSEGAFLVTDSLTLGATTGAFKKRGEGTLTLVGTSADLALSVEEGTTVLASASGASAKDVTVAEGATVKLGADEQVADGGSLTVFGTLDLNGHRETVRTFGNNCRDTQTETFYTNQTARLVNTATEAATLTTCESSSESAGYHHYRGAVEECPGKITIKYRKATVGLMGAAGTVNPSQVVLSPSTYLYEANQSTKFVFKFRKPKSSTALLAVSDIILTWKGLPIDLSRATITDADGKDVKATLGDLNGATQLQKSGTEMVVNIDFGSNAEVLVDGYRIGIPDSLDNMPTEWDVYAYRNTYIAMGHVLVDSRTGQDGFPLAAMMTPVYPFSAETRPSASFSEKTALSIDGQGATQNVRVLTTDPLRLASLVGEFNIQLLKGSSLVSASMTEWTGAPICEETTRAGMGHLLLSAQTGAEQALPRLSSALKFRNLSIEPDGTDEVSVKIPDGVTVDVRLADGEGRLGLVKEGAGTATLSTYEAAYSGPTEVRAGTLQVKGVLTGKVTTKYLRFTTTMVVGGVGFKDSNKFNIALCEIQLDNEKGQKVAWPQGTTITAAHGFQSGSQWRSLIDGDTGTRCLVSAGSEVSDVLDPLVFTLPEPVTFSGYRFWGSNVNNADKNRTPVAWTIDVSEDGQTWQTVHVGTTAYSSLAAYGPFSLGSSAPETPLLPTISAAFVAPDAMTAHDATVPAFAARYFRFLPLRTLCDDQAKPGEYAYGWQLAEISLYRNGERLAWDGAKATVPSDALSSQNGSSAKNLVDNVVTGSAISSSVEQGRAFFTKVPSYVVIDAGRQVTFDAYGFTATGANSIRTPSGWVLSVSSDGTTWETLDAVERCVDVHTVTEHKDFGPWTLAGKHVVPGRGAVNAVSDASEVRLSAGATLALDTDYEKVGALAGAGTVAFSPIGTANVLGLATTNNTAAFTGAVTGRGTLEISGEGTQTFDGADLSGVTSLVLTGGTVTGTASVAGDLTVDFAGGVTALELTGIGALTVTGEPQIALPKELTEAFRQTLFTYGSIDEASAEKLKSAEIVGEVPAGLKAKIHVGEKSCILTASADSTVILFR